MPNGIISAWRVSNGNYEKDNKVNLIHKNNSKNTSLLSIHGCNKVLDKVAYKKLLTFDRKTTKPIKIYVSKHRDK